MTLNMPFYAIRELAEKNSQVQWEIATEPIVLTVSLEKLDLFPDFELFNPKMFDPGYHFTPSILYWDYGQNKPQFISSTAHSETMVFGRNDSRTMLKTWEILETTELSGSLNLLIFMHATSEKTISLTQQMKTMNQMLDKSLLRTSIRQLLRTGEVKQFTAIDRSLERLHQEIRKATEDWPSPVCFLNQITLKRDDLKSGQPIHIHKAPFFEMKFSINLSPVS